ncbi:hypothetical protein ANCDUO_04405 [Ancylostoma duodenale]|uniref:Leucine Rich repeat-containing domain protein n=1 Tax=Ancylostoma duodenale TaxID=51022 RepID=A0A0C2H741_9BILA|nr:hypothetical protein ANCDUO_04405 [Ancylostoma duodenale]
MKCRISRRWYRVSRQDALWRHAKFSGDSRLNLRQLTAFAKSPLAAKVVSLSLEGYIVRTARMYSHSTITNHVLSLMGRKMEKLRSLTIENANISNIAFKCMPKNLERLCLTGSIIGYCALDDLAHPGTLPALRELNLDYVHNLSSNSRSFRLREVWILQFMTGCAGARISLKEAGSSLLVLDEIDRQKMAVPQRMDFYSIYFANVFGNAASGEVVEDV